MTTSTPTLEDLLAEWWRDSYPSSTLNPQTGRMMVAFAAYAIEQTALAAAKRNLERGQIQ